MLVNLKFLKKNLIKNLRHIWRKIRGYDRIIQCDVILIDFVLQFI